MRAFYILVFLCISTWGSGQSALEKKLFELPDVIFEEIETPRGYQSAYKLLVRQPLDHSDPSAGHFYQKVYLSHVDFKAPAVLVTNGYARNSNNITEVSRIIDANQLNVEHRYFGESMPDSLDYKYLNFRQVAGDLHRIRQLFSTIYENKWVSTGISKGGTTTLVYRYFYPDDVAVSIPYVAPINYSEEDTRIYKFLDTIGTDSCRKAIYNFQVRMLRGHDRLMGKIYWYTKGKGLKFSYLDLEEAYEYAVLEYPFSFWQYGHDCSAIPGPDADMDTHIQHLLDVVGMEFYSDSSMEAYGSHYYQSATEMGYYGFDLKNFRHLIKFLPVDTNPSAAFVPGKTKVDFSGALMHKVAEWLRTGGDSIIYINGAIDTWSATAVPPSDGVEALWFFLEGKHHGNARIRNMNEDDLTLLTKNLSEWLEHPVSTDALTRTTEATRLATMMKGSYSNSAQSQEDSSFHHIALHMYPIWKDSDNSWLYVEEGLADHPMQPYLQRVYKFIDMPDGKVKRIEYRLNDPASFLNKWKELSFFNNYDPSILRKEEGCGVIFEKTPFGYRGNSRGSGCLSGMHGAERVGTEIFLRSGVIEILLKGYDSKGNHLWGGPGDIYIYNKK